MKANQAAARFSRTKWRKERTMKPEGWGGLGETERGTSE